MALRLCPLAAAFRISECGSRQDRPVGIVLVSHGSSMAEKDEGEKTIAEDLVVTKYKMAGDIVNRKYSHGASIEPIEAFAAPETCTGGPFEKMPRRCP